MLVRLRQFVKKLVSRLSSAAHQLFRHVTRPARLNLVTGTLADLPRGVRQLVRILKEYVCYFNQARPQQGIAQRILERMQAPPQEPKAGKVIAFPVLNGLHHHYRWAA